MSQFDTINKQGFSLDFSQIVELENMVFYGIIKYQAFLRPVSNCIWLKPDMWQESN